MSPRALKVFEHQTLRVGEESRGDHRDGISLTEREFDALVRFNDAHGARYFGVGHRRITFKQYVGYIQVGDLGIEVLPKADRSTASAADEARWRDGLLRMLEVAVGMRLEHPTSAAQEITRSNLLELVVQRFVQQADAILHQGLARGYRNEEANGTTFRGRLLIAENLRQNLVRPDRFFVRYQTYDCDVVVNQILGAALAAIGDLPLAASVAARAAECRAHFPEVSTLHSVETAMERLVLGRNTERYREALVLARMILGQYAPQLRAGAVAVFGLLFDMNSLWERYVAALFRRADVPGLTVRTQSSVRFWKSDGESTRTIRPDIVVRAGPATVLVVDTKWKVSNDGSPSDDDLKQMFAYNELLDAPHALLVYPSDGAKVVSKSGAFSDRKHRCGTLHLGLFDACGWSASAMQAEVRALLAGHARLGSSVTVPEREPGRSQLRARVRA